ncbi:MAG: TIGR02466 family protein [Pseudohongiellaceae bacterium]
MEIGTQALFPSLVWSTLFDDRVSFNAKLLELANQLRSSDPEGVNNTNVNGWQSPNNLQNLPEFEDINLRILQVCERIAESQHFGPNVILQHQAWVNISPPGASNKLHYHANCHFSGVYYVSLKAPECGSIYFRDPRVASRMFTSPLIKQTEFTAEEVRMRVEEGRMYVFPGWLEHGVEINESNEDRVSISFNVLAIPQPSSDG